MRLVWSLGLERLQREWKEGKTAITPLLLCVLVAIFFFSLFFPFLFFFSLILWEWGGLPSFLFGLPPRHPSFTHSRIGLLPISQQWSRCWRGRDCGDRSIPALLLVLSSHRQQMSRFLRERASLRWPLAASETKSKKIFSRVSKPATSQNSELTGKRLAVEYTLRHTQMNSSTHKHSPRRVRAPFLFLIYPDTKTDKLHRMVAAADLSNEKHLASPTANQHTSKSCSPRPEHSNGNKLFGQQTRL